MNRSVHKRNGSASKRRTNGTGANEHGEARAPGRTFPQRCGNSGLYESTLYGSALPFEIHNSGDAQPFLHRSRIGSELGVSALRRIMELADHEGSIADVALQAGLRITIKCCPEFAPDIAGAFAQRVPSRSLVYYDPDGGRLVFRHEHEEDRVAKREGNGE